MIDCGWLSSWIKPHHIYGDALQAYRQAFTSHPAHLIVLRDFLLEGIVEKLSQFLTVEAEFRPHYGLYSSLGDRDANENEWLAAKDHDRFFKFSKCSGIHPQFQLSPNLLLLLKFRQALDDPKFAAFFEEISGLALGPLVFNIHSMKAGDFLRPHTDDAENRRLAFVLYLSPTWEPRFGGALLVVEPGGKVSKVDAEYNSLVVVDVTAKMEHFIAPVEAIAGETARLTIGGWISGGD